MTDSDNSHPRLPEETRRIISYNLPTYDGYEFPTVRLRDTLTDPSKTPLALVACGSFSPITHLHLRIFEMASDYCKLDTNFEVMGGYLSAVSDAYKKQGLAPAKHRVHMCQVACEQTSSWLQVDTWEPFCPEYLPTAKVLDHFDYELNTVRGGAKIVDAEGKEIGRKPYKIVLLAGSDLIMTMSEPGLWAPEDLDHILGKYGAFIVERAGTDIDAALANLQAWKENIYVIRQLIQNDISSTKIRNFLKQGMSVLYLIPASVINYIVENGLYVDEYNKKIEEAEKKVKAEEEKMAANKDKQAVDDRVKDSDADSGVEA
ncbi:hypothetical protein TWF225_006443 [Orbilia oligospora]|uniref:Nicotinamide-nucleotide adenylyltransferase n=1 Tax=Orbilia oligospora TaxID=2813651 RepID=A0A7C8JUZ2_ORBOL|nr:hypothetical protein TWF751_004534 [Orbilia oligospora]KAF3182532.1 hypothetical protein TWF225_006443 [Orbilia oligospora]KAF3255648.1 hypothetical protein TWF217_006477 [Orbilia oligospora]KAF3256293.1 hypothetical protein TWF128_005362 [Orbilia oligospora]KAF3290597.1 hypothetical protein TWF132_006912 [Orbilia oligospora]